MLAQNATNDSVPLKHRDEFLILRWSSRQNSLPTLSPIQIFRISLKNRFSDTVTGILKIFFCLYFGY